MPSLTEGSLTCAEQHLFTVNGLHVFSSIFRRTKDNFARMGCNHTDINYTERKDLFLTFEMKPERRKLFENFFEFVFM